MSKPGIPVSARRAASLVSVAALLTVAAACSSSSKSSPSSSSSSKPPASSSPSSPSSPAAGGTTVNSGMAGVMGAQTTVLTAPDGHTLYFFDPDSAGGQPTCTGSCAAMWPPLTASSPSAASGVTGKLTVSTSGNSTQVIYNGHPLYEFKNDTAAGQANGDGFAGKWHVATPTLAAGASSGTPAPSSPSTSGSGGGYGSGGY